MNHPINIMIADDEEAIRNGLLQITSSKHFETKVVALADNGINALQMLLQYQPDIAIIDINMPGMDGLEVIKNAVENHCETYFFILSGYNDFTYAQKAISYGVKSYFLKPINVLEFREQFWKQCQEILAKKNIPEKFSSRKLSSLMASSRIFFLNQLIQNRFLTSYDIFTKLSLLNLSISDTRSIVVIFRFSEMLCGSMNLSEVNGKYIAGSFSDFAMESWVYDENQIVAVFNLENDLDENFRRALKSCLDLLRLEIHYLPVAGIGNEVPGLSQCYSSYLKAQEALSYHIYKTEAQIFDSHLIPYNKPTLQKESIDAKPLVQFIIQNDLTGIKEYCSSFFKSLLSTRMPPPNYLAGMCMYLIVNVQTQLLASYPDMQPELETDTEEISNLKSLESMQEWLVSTFSGYCSLLRNFAFDDQGIIKASKDYIQNNLHKNIKARDVAACVNLSETYFPIYFKNKTGVNFRDYILQSRIEYAKTLLRTKKESICEIAYLTGYQDYRSFSRAFKNETGMSPSDYSDYPS